MHAPPLLPNQAGPPLSADKERLLQVLGRTLDVAMGLRPFAPRWLFGPPSPGSVALGWLLVYVPAAATALWLSADWFATDWFAKDWAAKDGSPEHLLAQGHARLAGIIAWATLYFAGAIAATRAATAAALAVVRWDILPHATDAYAKAVADDIERRDSHRGWQMVPWVLGAGAAVVAVWATSWDVAPLNWSSRPFPFDLLLWAGTSFYLCYTAVRAVMYATFHRSFASRLDPATAPFYALAAADTPLVLGLSRLNKRILGYWATIFLTIVAVLILLVLPHPFDLPDDSKFLYILLVVSGFFSFVFGSFVYLQNESEIRAALRRFTLATAMPFQQRANELLRRPDPSKLTDGEAEEIERLRDLSERIIAGGRYGSRLLTGFSIVLPLILPVISLIQLIIRSLIGAS